MMNSDLLKELSNADSIASCENEVRNILYKELKDYCDEIYCDSLGSIIFHKKGNSQNPIKIMFAAHMDEVGFIVRYISDIGFLYVMNVGGVLDKSKEMQIVRITTKFNHKIYGLMNVTKDDNGNIKDIYVDIGCDSEQEVKNLGVDIGDMVCFASDMKQIQDNVYMGKAMDDRSGCYVLAEALKQMKDNDNDLYFVGTSSEEVGTRGGRVATNMIQPDVFYAVDVANNPELIRNYTNHRLIGKGPMIIHYDKTMAPNRKLLAYVKKIADKNNIDYQCDMLGGGGTDAGNAHLEDGGRLALVLGIPLRYCHGSYSMVHSHDLNCLIELVCELAQMNIGELNSIKNFLEGNEDD
ncbi:MAG: aminopeptidase [Erysipelotrichaceae bacterium]|nr:aminopeptidase [Erysipelotrichaceae bacterium]